MSLTHLLLSLFTSKWGPAGCSVRGRGEERAVPPVRAARSLHVTLGSCALSLWTPLWK